MKKFVQGVAVSLYYGFDNLNQRLGYHAHATTFDFKSGNGFSRKSVITAVRDAIRNLSPIDYNVNLANMSVVRSPDGELKYYLDFDNRVNILDVQRYLQDYSKLIDMHIDNSHPAEELDLLLNVNKINRPKE